MLAKNRVKCITFRSLEADYLPVSQFFHLLIRKRVSVTSQLSASSFLSAGGIIVHPSLCCCEDYKSIHAQNLMQGLHMPSAMLLLC